MSTDKLLFAWIGQTDLDAAKGVESAGNGPLCQAVLDRKYQNVTLLSNYDVKISKSYKDWLEKTTGCQSSLERVTLSSPMDFGEIYKEASAVLTHKQKEFDKAEFCFHLSPGTSAMAAVWIIFAKTKFPAELIASAKGKGVRTVDFPFDLQAEYIPAIRQQPPERVIQLVEGLPPPSPAFAHIVHDCPSMRDLIARARVVSGLDFPVLILGETGTGKELLARAIHLESTRGKREMIALNCGAIPKELLEGELFGYMKGAFTGANHNHTGLIEQANGSTLFLDEIGELPLQAQVKLLRVLQEKTVTPLLGKPKKVDIRVICATHRDLLNEISSGTFREDLFHRVGVAILNIPPLRARGRDLDILIDQAVQSANDQLATSPTYIRKKLSIPARKLLLSHSWPGNIRELHNTITRAILWATSESISVDEIREAILKPPARTEQILGRQLGLGFNLEDTLGEVAKHYLVRAEQEAKNKTEAASLLGLPSYQTYSNWATKYMRKK